eukprot:g1497.t1
MKVSKEQLADQRSSGIVRIAFLATTVLKQDQCKIGISRRPSQSNVQRSSFFHAFFELFFHSSDLEMVKLL